MFASRASSSSVVASVASVGIGAVAISLLARVEIPFVPVPFTLLTLGAMLAGVLLGRRDGVAAAALWIAFGAMGLPVFASGKLGLAAILGPTGGYILALPLVALGWSALASGVNARSIALAVGASLAHLALGTIWLANFMGLSGAFLAGFAPYVLAEIAKGLVVAIVALAGTKTAGARRIPPAF